VEGTVFVLDGDPELDEVVAALGGPPAPARSDTP
jgi:hypothetical protein